MKTLTVLGLTIILFNGLEIGTTFSAPKDAKANTGNADPIPIGAWCGSSFSVKDGQTCRLTQNVTLTSTLLINSNKKLDCQGHTISAATPGVPGYNNTRSDPPLAIFLNGVSNTLIQDCVFEGFDHVILAINSKVPAELKDDPESLAPLRNRILHNTITAPFVPIHLVSSDNFDIEGNTITWETRGGAGIFIQHNSDLNDINNNIVTGDFPASTQGAVLFPGPTAMGVPPASILNSNPIFLSAHAPIVVAKVLGPHPHLFNSIIGGELFQFQDAEDLEPDEHFAEDNLLENNVILFTKTNTTEDGILASNTVRTTVQNNVIGRSSDDPSGPDGGRRASIRAGGFRPVAPAAGRVFPGTCRLNSTRQCLSAYDCNIPSIDAVDQGPCDNIHQIYPTYYSQGFTVENNTMYGPMQFGVGANGLDATVQNNSITGPLTPPPVNQVSAGIILEGKFVLESAVIMGNTIKDCSVGMALLKLFQGSLGPDFFGAQISHNSITGYSTAIQTRETQAGGPYNVPSEFSVAGEGNYWGLTCEQNGFDQTKVLQADGSVNEDVVDSHPFGTEDMQSTCF